MQCDIYMARKSYMHCVYGVLGVYSCSLQWRRTLFKEI